MGADVAPMMVKLGEGFSTCREHGGRFAGDLAALDHLELEHPGLVAQLRGARTIALAPDDDPAEVIARQQPNRRARRRHLR